MEVSPKVDKKPVVDLPNSPCGANYVVGGGVVVHHEGAT